MTREDWLTIGPVGWQPLLLDLDAKLQKHWPDYTIDQVKEKFGTLRFYAEPGIEPPDFPNDEAGTAAHNQWYAENVDVFYALIDECEAKTAEVCQMCGKPGKLGNRNYWWATRCPGCAPEGWVAADVECDHPSITNGSCDDCGHICIARLEHADCLLTNTHQFGSCLGEHCTLHHRSDHLMRSFPQHWRTDRMMMERICPHGIGHPDPYDFKLVGPYGPDEAIHSCDGCCEQGTK